MWHAATDQLPLEQSAGEKALGLSCCLRFLEDRYAKELSWPMVTPSPSLMVLQIRFLQEPYVTLFLGMLQRAWVWETNLGPDSILPFTGHEILGRLPNFVESIFSSEKQTSMS